MKADGATDLAKGADRDEQGSGRERGTNCADGGG